MTSTIFQMGRCEMELQSHEQAMAYFLRTQEMFKSQLQALTLTASNGASTTTSALSLTEMVKPSIFDTDEMKKVKSFMIEIQEYIQEIEYTKANKEVLDKERNEAKAK